MGCALVALLRQTELLPVGLGLAAESAVYSMLLAGPEFGAWRAARPVRPAGDPDLPVLLSRDGELLTITLNRAERRNAFGVAIRDGLLEAFDLVEADPSIARVHLRGSGPALSSGGDLDEFGTATDVTLAHLVRLRGRVGARLHAQRDRVTAFVHGACIGAGVEVPAFAGRVVATPDAFFRLPELAVGLVPGAGGTVSIGRRIGRHRTAYLALSGARVDAAQALDWMLVDALDG
jgi:enoyl-CoA hydratase/carnithine racemase